jgi:hypothetical protein
MSGSSQPCTITIAVLSTAMLAVACAKSGREPQPQPASDQPVSEPSQRPAPSNPPHSQGLVDDQLFAVETIMRHQSALDITPEQKDTILSELDTAQKKLNRLEWELNGAKEKLVSQLEADEVDEDAAIEAGRRVTDLEGELKIAHLRLLVRVKNQLTDEQENELQKLRKRSP